MSVPECLNQEIQKGNSLGGATLPSSHGSAHKAVQPRPDLAGDRISRGRSVPGDLDGYRVLVVHEERTDLCLHRHRRRRTDEAFPCPADRHLTGRNVGSQIRPRKGRPLTLVQSEEDTR